MKIETVSEHVRPGRVLPLNCQWDGRDKPGGGAAKRRLRQIERGFLKENKARQT